MIDDDDDDGYGGDHHGDDYSMTRDEKRRSEADDDQSDATIAFDAAPHADANASLELVNGRRSEHPITPRDPSKKKRLLNWFGGGGDGSGGGGGTISKRTYDQILAHAMLLLSMIIFGGFVIVAPASMNQMHPFVFCFFRNLVLIFSLIPFVCTVDRSFEFRPQQQQQQELQLQEHQHQQPHPSHLKLLLGLIYRRIPTLKQSYQLALTGSFLFYHSIARRLLRLSTSPPVV